ncbi:MAG TPA: class III poly(R)-hydroxyalkanoic acid synthase subunit PhaE [Gammaproteobacteria bacterium]|nr:class III poly(R)-hydroxyalkanoic acid synthase subunit PhaE [Gammaproteobacteria bacterium]
MSETNPWASQWFDAQQQFVDAWSDMANSGKQGKPSSQSDLWAQSFDMWRKASGAQAQPEIQQAVDKCFDMGKEYFAMAEQISKSLSAGAKPIDAINQWMEQLKGSLQQLGAVPGFDGSGVNDFMKQWFSPSQSWQEMTAALTPMNQAAWQLPGMNSSIFNLGEVVDPLGKMLEAPGIGYFREPQEKQQKGLQLAVEYQEANQAFNQAFLRVATESIQGFQARLMKVDPAAMPRSLRELYDLWVEVSEEHYAEFAMSEEYQALYGDMVNRLMIMKKHYSEITDDLLRAMNLPNTREVDTMQQRLQQLRRENIVLKNEVSEIKTMLQELTSRRPQAPAASSAKAAPAASDAKAAPAASDAKAAPAASSTKAASAASSAKAAPAASSAKAAPAASDAKAAPAASDAKAAPAASKSNPVPAATKTAPKAAAKSSVKKLPAKKSPAKKVAKKAAPKKKSVVTKVSKGA